MKKIPTLFKRVYENHKVVGITDEVTPGCEIVLEGKCNATIKMDGSACAIIDGVFYKRYDAKKGKKIPKNAIKCQDEPDPITGHMPCWIPVDEDNPADKWFIEAEKNYHADNTSPGYMFNRTAEGTYEAIGPHFNGNNHHLEKDTLVRHGIYIIDGLSKKPLTFEMIRDFLSQNYIEGIVFWAGEPICKIKRSDFGFEWGNKR